MKKVSSVLAVLVLVFSTAPLYADGRFFVREKVPASIPYQRALLMFEDGCETLILQSKYHLHASGTGPFLGWVVRIPAVPELATMDAEIADCIFELCNIHNFLTKYPRGSNLPRHH